MVEESPMVPAFSKLTHVQAPNATQEQTGICGGTRETPSWVCKELQCRDEFTRQKIQESPSLLFPRIKAGEERP